MHTRHAVTAAMLASIVFVTACGGGGDTKGCDVDAQCTAAGAHCVDHACQIALTVVLSSPDHPVATNASVDVQVEVLYGTPAAVSILIDGQSTASVPRGASGLYEYSWDTTQTPEGLHQLMARVVAGAQHYDSPAITVTVDRHAPAPPAFGSPAIAATAAPTVAGTTEPGAVVAVLDGGVLQGAATASAGGSWSLSLTGLAEGTHALSAIATDPAGNVSGPGAQSLVVDLTDPAVTGRTPSANVATVWSRDDVLVTFSERIAAGTVSPTTVRLAGNAGAITVTPTLSDDGRVLTIHPPSPLPPVPNHLTLTLDGLTDAAGRRLAATSWGWDLPEWVEAASPERLSGETDVRFAWGLVPSAGKPRGVVFWRDMYGPGHKELLIWSGTTWGGGASIRRNTGSMSQGEVAVAADGAGAIYVAYNERLGATGIYQVYVDRYSGGAITPLGGALNADVTRNGSGIAIRLDENGNPFVLWKEPVNGPDHYFVSHWNGSSWDPINEYSISGSASAQDLAVASSSRVSLAFVLNGNVYLRRVRGTAPVEAPYQALGTGAAEVAIAIDDTGLEVLAYAAAGSVFTAKPGLGSAGPTWTATGGPFGASASSPSLLFRPSAPSGQQLALAWTEAGSGAAAGPRIMTSGGSGWTSISSNIGIPVGAVTPRGGNLAATPSAAVGYAPGGVLSFAWAEGRGGYYSPTVVSMLYNR